MFLKKTLAYRVVFIAFGIILSACNDFFSSTPSVELNDSGSQSEISVENKQYYQEVLQLLRESEDVIPPTPEVHPVTAVFNREAIIPPMCYTKTEGSNNPCYVCHQDAIPGRENVMNDGELQAAYSFSDLGQKNHWNNLFTDRSEAISKISDSEILAWVNQNNYGELAQNLEKENFKGWIPDLTNLHLGKEAFDEYGFARDDSHWVAFNYKPFPSTFWPTNGSTDDVMIRLPEAYRTTKSGQYSLDVYRVNLAVVEATIKGLSSISMLPVDERLLGVDLDGSGNLGMADYLKNAGQYFGAAESFHREDYVYPEGTEFLHTVRYLGFSQDGEIEPSTRIKEVRYMKKWKAYPKGSLARYYEEEAFDKEAGNLPGYTNLGHYGLDNDMGWSVQGFIENKSGRLRVASYEENLFCMGCHGSIGSTIDKTFSFARKVNGKQGWGYIDLKNMPDAPTMGETQGEYLTYFERAGGGDEFRSNAEMYERWFKPNGEVDRDKITGKDVYTLVSPSRKRAMGLNKAYLLIVKEQSYVFGREPRINKPINVYEAIDNLTAPTLSEEHIYSWDIRLNWDHESKLASKEEKKKNI